MIPIPIWILLAAVIAWCASAGGAYVYGRSDGRDLQQATQRREDDIESRATDAAIKAAAVAIANIEVKHVTVKQRVETEIRDRPVYRDCQHPAGVLRDINEALTGQPQPAGDRKLPSPDAAH